MNSTQWTQISPLRCDAGNDNDDGNGCCWLIKQALPSVRFGFWNFQNLGSSPRLVEPHEQTDGTVWKININFTTHVKNSECVRTPFDFFFLSKEKRVTFFKKIKRIGKPFYWLDFWKKVLHPCPHSMATWRFEHLSLLFPKFSIRFTSQNPKIIDVYVECVTEGLI